MTLDTWYWPFMALWLAFGVYQNRAGFAEGGWLGPVGGIGLQFLPFLIIGLRLFGSPVK